MSRPNATTRMLTIVFCAALVLRLLFCCAHRFEPDRLSTPDSRIYAELAQNLATEGRFARGPAFSLENPVPREIFRTPGYPLFLLLPQPILIQILLGAALAVGAALIFGRLFGTRAGLLCGLLLAADPGHVVYANMLMSDILFAALLMASLILLERHYDHPHSGSWPLALAGLVLTLSAAVRPLGGWIFVVAAVWLMFRRTARRQVALFCLLALVFPVAWGLRNLAVAGTFSSSSAFHYNLYRVAASKVTARAEGIPRWQAEERLVQQAVDEAPLQDIPALNGWFLRQAGAVFARHPGHTAVEAVSSAAEMVLAGERRNLLKLLGARGGADTVRTISDGKRDGSELVGYLQRAGPWETALVAVQVCFNTVILLFFIDGVRRWLAREDRGIGVLFLSLLLYVLLVSLVVASARMRIPVSFIIYGFAAHSIISLSARMTSRNESTIIR